MAKQYKFDLPGKIRLTIASRNMDVVDVGPGEVWLDEDVADHPYLRTLGLSSQGERTVKAAPDDAEPPAKDDASKPAPKDDVPKPAAPEKK